VRSAFTYLLLIIASLLPLSCGKEKNLVLDLNFSVNVARPAKTFPDMKHLVKSKQTVYEMYGRPDFIRFWWSRDGRPHRFLEVDGVLRNSDSIYALKHSWVYLDKDREFIFDSDDAYREIPLTDKVRTICNYGDPEDIKQVSVPDGPVEEIWHYYSIGLILKFSNEKLISRQSHTPMGNFIKR
jgi:hypothetical protein